MDLSPMLSPFAAIWIVVLLMDFALVSDSDDEDGKVVCFICPFAFSNLSDAEHHFKEKHTDGLKSEKSIGIQDSTF